MNALTQSLAMRHPLVQAPMAGIQGSAMAIAACGAGALGSLACAMLGAKALQDELSAMSAATHCAFNVNFFCHTPPPPLNQAAWLNALAPYFAEIGLSAPEASNHPGRLPLSAEMVDVIEPFKPKVVSTHFGLPSPDLMRRAKAWGAQVWASATTVAEAKWLQAHGADAVIAQGLEAGGHRGHFLSDDLSLQMGTMALLPQVVAAVSVPVVAAGGIASAEGVRAAMTLGASAVQVGTAFMLCHEAHTSEPHRAALSAHGDTQLTRLFTGRPARGIVNRLMRDLGPMNALAPEFPQAGVALAPLRAAAELLGKSDFSPLWSGQNSRFCATISTRDMVARLVASASQLN